MMTRKKGMQKDLKMFVWQDALKEITVKFNKPVLVELKADDFKLWQFKNGRRKRLCLEKEVLVLDKDETGIKKIALKTLDKLPVECFFELEYFDLKAEIRPRLVLNDSLYCYKGQLGFIYAKEITEFILWAPTAKKVELLLYQNEISQEEQKLVMTKGSNGEWKITVAGDQNGKYYLYAIHFATNKKEDLINVALDPYATATSANSKRCLIYDLREITQNIQGWQEDRFVYLKNNVDAILYEMHIRDMTISETGNVKDDWRGKFLALTEENTLSKEGMKTALDHLTELGITHVHLMPVFDYATGDETEDTRCATWYNWGYDPILYNNIEGSYATNPFGTARQKEFKQMVLAMHKRNIGVVCDVVYNHTYHTGTGEKSVFDKIVPGFYYRLDDEGNYLNGSGCGNDLATERTMVRKLIVDSCRFWVNEYHIDGFRFDLMGLIDKETMKLVYQEVKAINPSAIIYGEAWNMPTGLLDCEKMHQRNVRGTGIAAFNDGFRDSLKGDVFKQNEPGFVQGKRPYLGVERLKYQIKGQETGRDPLPIEIISPNETVNYVSAHDNACLWDKLLFTCPEADVEDRKKMVRLAFAILLTSQGIPFLTEGDEFCRSKKGNDNSYNNNDQDVNPIDWHLKAENKDIFFYSKGLIELRKQHPAFRIFERKVVDAHLHFIPRLEENVLAYLLFDHANNDSWGTIFVGYNATFKAQDIQLKGTWHVVADEKTAGVKTLKTVLNKISLKPLSAVIAWH